MHRVILLAGASGSGKSRLAESTGCPRLALDDLYFNGDHPGLPRTLGIVDWDDIRSWDVDGAVMAISSLCHTGSAVVPSYDIASNAQIGSQRLDLGKHWLFVAEGVFAPDMVQPCRDAGLEVEALYLDRSRYLSLVLRFIRDLREHRKPPWVLIRRGFTLWRAEPAVRRHAVEQGCRPVSYQQAVAAINCRPGDSSHHDR